MPELPLHGVPETHLPPPPADLTAALDDVRALIGTDSANDVEIDRRLREIAAGHPAYLAVWAALADRALAAGDPVAGYAFARTGYHRGLDAIRRAGWRGQGPVPHAHPPNRGFLDCVHALLRAAEAINEDDEAQRCQTFLLQLDPPDTLGVG